MSNEELCAAIQAGERDKLETLWSKCERFIDMMAGKYYALLDGRSTADRSDLYQSGYIALVEAAKSFDVNSGFKFLTWLGYHLKRTFGDTAGIRTKAGRRFNNALSLDAPLSTSDGEETTLQDTVPDLRCHIDNVIERLYIEELHAVLSGMIGMLPVDTAAVINARYFDDLTGAELADAAGVAPEHVNKHLTKGLNDLRRMTRTTPLGRKLNSFRQGNEYQHVSLDGFLRSRTSAVEQAVIQREASELRAWERAPLRMFPPEEAAILAAYRNASPELGKLTREYVDKVKRSHTYGENNHKSGQGYKSKVY